MASRTNNTTQLVLAKDNSAPVNLSQTTSSVLFVREAAFTKESVWLNGLKQTVLVNDTSAPVHTTGSSQQLLIVTAAAPGVDASYIGQAVHQAIFAEAGEKVHATDVSHHTLIVTERPPGSDMVNITTATQSVLFSEPAYVKISGSSQQLLITTDPAPPLTAPSISAVYASTLYVDPPAPSRMGQVASSSIILLEGPILTVGNTQTTQSALTLDLSRGTTLANGSGQLTLLLTEAKSRDPDRTKVLTISNSYTKPYAHPSTLASNHRARMLVRTDVLSTKFKVPTAVAAAYRGKVLVTGSASPQEYVDPRELAAKIQANTLEVAAIVRAPYPEKVISDVDVATLIHELALELDVPNPIDMQSPSNVCLLSHDIAAAAEFLSPLDARSPRTSHSMVEEIATVAEAPDPTTYRTVKQALQLAEMFAVASDIIEDPIDLKSQNQALLLDFATAHATPEYPERVQSETEVGTLSVEVLSLSEYIIPTDPMFKSMIHLNRFKFEAASASSMSTDPGLMQSLSSTRSISLRHCVKTTYANPDDVKSTNVVCNILTGLALSRQMVDPAGVKPVRQAYQIQWLSAYTNDTYNILPKSSVNVQRMKTEIAAPCPMIDPVLLGITDRGYQMSILAAVTAEYADPGTPKPNRRISSATVTRKAA